MPKGALAGAETINRRVIYFAPNGRVMDGSRSGEFKDGICIRTPDLSDREIRELGLEGKVLPGTEDANRLYGT